MIGKKILICCVYPFLNAKGTVFVKIHFQFGVTLRVRFTHEFGHDAIAWSQHGLVTIRYICLCNEWIQGRCMERIRIIMFYFNLIKQYLTLK